MRTSGHQAAPEVSIGHHVADILAQVHNKFIAIEIQCSPIKIEDILDRIAWYTKNNIHTLWILGELGYEAYASLDPDLVGLSQWKKLILSLQGLLFFHSHGLSLIPAKYGHGIELGREIDLDRLSFGTSDRFNFKSVVGVTKKIKEEEDFDYEDWELWASLNKEKAI